MKTYKYLSLAAAVALLSACNDLDTQPFGDVVTSEQKDEVYEANPEMIQAAVQSMPAAMFTMMGSYSDFGRLDTDFGYPSLMIMFDSKGMDMPSIQGDYQWYTAALSMADFGDTYYDNLITWNTWYKLIYTTNSVCNAIDPETTDPFLQFSLANAYGFRAFAYYMLSQVYQFTYVGHENETTVPVLTNLNADEAALEGIALATNAELYTQVMTDLNNAIALFTSAESQGESRIDKTYFNSMVAYGLRARVNLTMGNWSEALSDAQTAIQKAQSAGLAPYSIEQLKTPRFYSSSDASYMWSINITESFLGAGAVRSFAGMMGAFITTGYAGKNGYWRAINKNLYATIPYTDVRKAWFVDPAGQAPTSLPAEYQAYVEEKELPAFTQLKFGPPNGIVNSDIAATDIPVMRVEEMYLIAAEAQGRISPAQGATDLVNFVKTYRDPAYAFAASSVDDLVDEVWMQRRVELWGEGFSFYDCKRLSKTINRVGAGYPAEWVFIVEPTNTCLNYNIPQTEQQGNPKVGSIPNVSQAPQQQPDVE